MTSKSCSLDRADIESLIPHRDPFLFLNSVRFDNLDNASGQYTWLPDHAIFTGHFPNFAIVPGVCQVEALAQLAGVLIASASVGDRSVKNYQTCFGVLASIRSASFHRQLVPGQKFDLSCKIRSLGCAAWLVSGFGNHLQQHIMSSEILLAAANGGSA